jgi:TonB family protein
MIKYISLWILCQLMVLDGICQTKKVKNDYESGRIKKGYKVGVWEYKGTEGDTELTIDYDQGTILYLQPDTSEYVIQVDSLWVSQRLTRHPRYAGSYAEFYQIISANMQYPEEARDKGIQGTVLLEFVVNPQGQVSHYQVIFDEEKYFTDEIIETFQRVPNLWIEAIHEGKTVPAKFIFPFHFRISGDKSIEYNEAILNHFEAKKMDAIVVTAVMPKSNSSE